MVSSQKCYVIWDFFICLDTIIINRFKKYFKKRSRIETNWDVLKERFSKVVFTGKKTAIGIDLTDQLIRYLIFCPKKNLCSSLQKLYSFVFCLFMFWLISIFTIITEK